MAPRTPALRTDRRFERVLVGSMGLGFLALLLAAGLVAWFSARNATFGAAVDHTNAVRQAVAEAQIGLEQSETARRGFLLADEPIFRTAFFRTQREMLEAIGRVREATLDNPAQTARIDHALARAVQLQAMRNHTIALVDQGRVAEALRAFQVDRSVAYTRALRYRLQAVALHETALLAQRREGQRSATFLFWLALGAAGLLLAIVGATSLLFVLRNTRALAASRSALERWNERLEAEVTERTADLTRANDEIQRFAYIVSHDLRSPLVNVMGFTAELDAATGPLRELVDRAETQAPAILTEDARLAAREDLPESIGFIRSSTQKMDRLINAILKLSREGRRTLAFEPLDLRALFDGIAASLRHMADERGAEVTVETPLPPLTSDRLAVEQIVSNLAENAVKYLKPGRPGRVVIRGRQERGRTLIEVVDNGRGIAPTDHARVFDLFRRSGTQDQPGEGIGLAHVRALAYRLGGNVDVVSTLGEGATFTLSLPTFPPVEPQDTPR